MDDKDRQIIRELQKDARLTNLELSERVNLSPSPCLRRVKLLEESGIIHGYTALINQKEYGVPITAFVRISLTQHEQDTVTDFEQHVANIEEIQDCYLITGKTDYMLRVVTSSHDSYEDFVREKLHKIEGIQSIDTSFAYSAVKQSNIYPRFIK
ncbi:MAG: Lrp/AsnC family transcriptional regulator [Arenicella sp.]